jgi:hypothetical protein
MSSVAIYVATLVVTMIASLAVVLVLRASLHRLLVDLCGTENRAAFWTAFSTVALVLAPLRARCTGGPKRAATRPTSWRRSSSGAGRAARGRAAGGRRAGALDRGLRAPAGRGTSRGRTSRAARRRPHERRA